MGGGGKQQGREHRGGRQGRETADERVGGNGRKRRGVKRDGERRQGGQKERRNREEANDRERRDSQSMKQFDNLVILLLTSIPPQRPAIKVDTQ